jgi:proline dehydrogenase
LSTTAAPVSKRTAVTTRVSGVLNLIFRKTILLATHNRVVAGGVRRFGMSLGAARFVAGETFEECAVVLKSLNDKGLKTNTTLLGEGVADEGMARDVVAAYIEILNGIHERGLKTNVALKLTHLGLNLGEEIAYKHVEQIVDHAASRGNFIRIDMEESARVDATLRIYRRLRESGHDNVGTVLQSALFRSEADLQDLMEYQPNLRLVKGAYLEPASIAHQKKEAVDAAFTRMAHFSLSNGGYTAIATHDERIIDNVIDYAARNNIGRDCFEFQMLYGISTHLQLSLVQRGFKVLVATPFGPEWYFYLMRRLAERPANLLFVLKGLRR